jgi:hypothetical protein
MKNSPKKPEPLTRGFVKVGRTEDQSTENRYWALVSANGNRQAFE